MFGHRQNPKCSYNCDYYIRATPSTIWVFSYRPMFSDGPFYPR